jgi:hypothetical protein
MNNTVEESKLKSDNNLETEIVEENQLEEITEENIIIAKMGMILKQTPELGETEARAQAEKEVEKGLKIWGSLNFKDHWYNVGESDSSENEQNHELWKKDIEDIESKVIKAVDDGDLDELASVFKGHYPEEDIHFQLKNIFQDIKDDALLNGAEVDEEVKKMIAINIFLLVNQGGEYPGIKKAVTKLSKDNFDSLQSILHNKNDPTCIDTSYLTKVLAKNVGVEGEVELVGEEDGDKIPHHYFKTNEGLAVDYWWNRKTFGLNFKKENE